MQRETMQVPVGSCAILKDNCKSIGDTLESKAQQTNSTPGLMNPSIQRLSVRWPNRDHEAAVSSTGTHVQLKSAGQTCFVAAVGLHAMHCSCWPALQPAVMITTTRKRKLITLMHALSRLA